MHGGRQIALQLYRLCVLVAIAWIVHAHHLRWRLGGLVPVTLEEVKELYPAAAEVLPEEGARAGWVVRDQAGHELGSVLRTAPYSDDIVGYRGSTDCLIAFDPGLRVLGVRVRSSQDTREHVGDVRGDPYFLKTWNGKSWAEVAGITPQEAGIEGVSGASMTSLAVAEGIVRRLRAADAAGALPAPPLKVRPADAALALIIAAAMVLAFKGTHGRPWLRRGFQALVIVYVGFLTGDLLAQSLLAGWVQFGIPWRTAPGLALLAAAALAVPWATRKPLYCQQLCPHGAAQELLSRAAPKRWRVALRPDFARGLHWLPGLLLAVVLTVVILILPVDLAHLEPFDAYLVRSAGWATVAIAIGGLVASLFVPMAYCHYGCPTGALLEFVRGHGRADAFGRRDAFALLLLLLAALLSWRHAAIHAWIIGPS